MSELAVQHLQVERLLDVERFDEARQLLARALREDPNDLQSLYLAGRVELEAGRPEAARGFVADTLARQPDHVGARLLLFRLHLEGKAHPQAEEVILGLLREFPEDGGLYAFYARLMMETLHLEKARALLDESLRLAPEGHLGRCLDILLRVIEGREAEAERRLGALVAEDPEASHVAWTCIGVLTARGRFREAMALARELLRASPDDPEVLEALINLRQQSHWTMVPLWPFARFGWGGSAAMWAIGVGGATLFSRFVSASAAGLFVGVYLAYCLYSWVWPPLLRRWLVWRGF